MVFLDFILPETAFYVLFYLRNLLYLIGLTAGQVTRIMNHINSTARASLNGNTPFELARLLLPGALLDWVGAAAIAHDDVLLKPRLLRT